MTATVFHGGVIHTLAEPADWVLVDADRVVATGRGEPPKAERAVQLEGGTLVPGFCDAHVHLPATGLYAAGLDFRGERRAATIVSALGAVAATGERVLFGGNFEDPLDAPLTRHDIDRVVGSSPAMLARADMHSCVVSTSLLDELDLTLPGIDRDGDGSPTGYVRAQAAAEAWRMFERMLGAAEHAKALHAAVELAYSKGITSVHEMFVVEWRSWDSLETVRDTLVGHALNVKLYVATDDVARVQALGLDCIGGDYFLDGSLGSHTAWLSAPYVSAPPAGSPSNGVAYRDDAALVELFSAAQAAGLQVGVHAIGDAAIEQAIASWEKVAADIGAAAVGDLGHRVEHFECSSDDHIARAAAIGLRASIQPAFDRLWGGTDGLYAQRLGEGRAREMNRFATMARAGLVIGAGSDSTVTPLDPFLQMASLRDHQEPDESLDPRAALELHTKGSNALAREERIRGTIEPGMKADLAWLDTDPLGADPGRLLQTQVAGTWVAGRRVWPPADAESQ